MDKITHFEIPINEENKEEAMDFYKEIFGWKVKKWNDEIPYWIIHTVAVNKHQMPKEPGAINGGFTTKDDISTPTVVISVDSIDEKLEKIEEKGGEIVMEKRPVGKMGFYARFRDTEGNIIGIWETAKKAD